MEIEIQVSTIEDSAPLYTISPDFPVRSDRELCLNADTAKEARS